MFSKYNSFNGVDQYMKIGFFSDSYLPTIHGVTVSMQNFRKGLEKIGQQVFIYAPYVKGYKEKETNIFRFRSLKMFDKSQLYLAFPFFPKNYPSKITKFKLDIAHAQSPFSLGLLAKYIAQRQNIPLVYTHHTHYPEYVKFYLKEKLLLPYLAQALSSWYSNMADAVISPSHKMKRLLEDYGVKRPIYVLPNGVDLDLFKKSEEEKIRLKKKYGIASETKILLFVGRMTKEKNLEFLLKAFKEILKKTKTPTLLFMVGPGPYLDNLRQLGDELGISQFINFTSSVVSSKIPEYYKMSDIFLFSSLTDNQPLVILEAIASSLPVVALKDDALEGTVIHKKNGFLIEEQDSKIFAKRVLELLSNIFLYEKFSKASLKIAANFSEENQAKKLLVIYKKIIKNKKK